MGIGASKSRRQGRGRGPHSGPPPAVSAHDRAVLDLKVQRDKLKQYSKRIEGVLELEAKLAREYVAKGDKRRALLALKKKKFQEGLVEKAELQLMTLEQLVATIEYAKIELTVVEGLKVGTQVLRDLQQEMKIEDVHQLMEENEEAIAYQNEVERAMGSRLTEEEESTVHAELERMEQELSDARLPSIEQSGARLDPLPAAAEAEQEETKPREPEREEKELETPLAIPG